MEIAYHQQTCLPRYNKNVDDSPIPNNNSYCLDHTVSTEHYGGIHHVLHIYNA